VTYTDNATDVVQRNLNTGVRSTFPTDQERTVVALNVTVPIYTGGFTSAPAARRPRSTTPASPATTAPSGW
jgi:hypothetical protein